MTPTKTDFDNAVKQNWHQQTCLIAQLMIRLHIPVVITDSAVPEVGHAVSEFTVRHRHELMPLMAIFDRNFETPGDESKAELVALRDSLPNEEAKI